VLRPDFAKVAAATRNYHTHYDSKSRRSVVTEPSELHWLSEEVRALLTACLLADLGVDDEISWGLQRTTRLVRGLLQRR
jgi:hypothetical protein